MREPAAGIAREPREAADRPQHEDFKHHQADG